MSNPVKLKSAFIEKYKKLENISLDLGANNICIVGENGVGKTSILEALFLSGSNLYDFPKGDVIKEYELDTQKYPELSKYKLKDKVIVKIKTNYSWRRQEIFSIKGAEKFSSRIEEKLSECNKDITEISLNIKSAVSSIKKYQDKINIDFGRNEFQHSPLFNNFTFTKQDLSPLLNFFENDRISDLLIKFNKETFDLFDPDLMNNLETIYYHGNKEFVDTRNIEQFIRNYKDCTIDIDGIEIDVEGIRDYVKTLNMKFNDLVKLLDKANNSYRETQEEVMRFDDNFYEIENDVKSFKKVLIDIISDYDDKIKYLPVVPWDRYPRKEEVDYESIKEISSLIGIKISEAKPFEKYSDGEKWVIRFAECVKDLNKNTILIDEPGMYLNPIMQNNLFKVFRYLNEREVKVVYTTHSNFMINFGRDINNYLVTDGMSIDVKKLETDDTYFLDKITAGELLLFSNKRIFVAESCNDLCLYRSFMKHVHNVDVDRFNFVDGSGNGAISIIDFCIKNNLSFSAILDKDKYELAKFELGKTLLKEYEHNIYFIGDVDEIEDVMSNTDIRFLCKRSGDKKEPKIKCKKIDSFFNNEKPIKLSKKLRSAIDNAFQDLQIY
ncbi:AAA family ATPase [Mycoplasmatota bacterium]|nr:AAA family ATPase [Mycoplasmatota bacterium]